MHIKNLPKFILSIFICQLAGVVGSLFTKGAIDGWYITLVKPVFSPPNWIFAPVWIILYFLMGIALYLVWETKVKKKQVNDAIQLFGVHLLINATWSIVFFGLKSPFLAFLNIMALWLLIILVIYKFWYVNKTAAYLLIPYLLWVSFATFLNYSIWVLNR